MPKVAYTGDRPWAVGSQQGLGREYVLEPGKQAEVDEGDVAKLSRMPDLREKLRVVREVGAEANKGEIRGPVPSAPPAGPPPLPRSKPGGRD